MSNLRDPKAFGEQVSNFVMHAPAGRLVISTVQGQYQYLVPVDLATTMVQYSAVIVSRIIKNNHASSCTHAYTENLSA